jgi:hypothetical protein
MFCPKPNETHSRKITAILNYLFLICCLQNLFSQENSASDRLTGIAGYHVFVLVRRTYTVLISAVNILTQRISGIIIINSNGQADSFK